MITCKHCGISKSTVCEHEKGYPDFEPRTHTGFLEKLLMAIISFPLTIIVGVFIYGWITILTDIPVQKEGFIIFALIPAFFTSISLAFYFD